MSAGQIGGAVVGGAVGFMVGGPAGAFVGAGIGAGLGGALGGEQKGVKPNINTDPGQTSTYGAFITRTRGTIGQSGNIIWLEGNKLRAKVKKAKKSGKGGGAPAAGATVTYFATFAVSLCEGPIAGVRRIWVGPDLFYDAGSDDLETIIASNKALKNFKIYLGTDTQAPDPRIQADRGAANTPAYPGLAYIVVTDLALAKYGNSIQGARIKVEVVNSLSYYGLRYSRENSSGWLASGAGGIVNVCNPLDKDLVSYICEKSGGSFFLRAASASGTSRLGIFSPSSIYSIGGLCDSAKYCLLNISGTALDVGGDVYTIPSSGAPGSARVMQSGQDVILYRYYGTQHLLNVKTLQTITVNTTGHALDAGFIYGYYEGEISVISVATMTLDHVVAVAGPVLTIASTSNTCVSSGIYWLLDGAKLIGIDLADGSTVYSSALSGTVSSMVVRDGVLAYANTGSVSAVWGTKIYSVSGLLAQSVPLSAIVTAEAARSILVQPDDIDSTLLAGSVIGYRVTAAGSIRDALEPLRAAFPFDACQSGYKIRFRSRGTGSVATIPIGHLIADTQLEESREMDSQLPQRVTVQYLDRDRDYDQNEQSDERLGAESEDEQTASVQVVMSAAHAKQTAEKLLYLAWLERYSYNFKLPPIYSGLESSDVITIAAEYANYEIRLVSANPDSDGVISCSGVPSNAAIYTSAATADAGQQAQVTIPLAGSSVAVLLDIPVVDETVQSAPGFVAAMTGYASGWAGGTVVRSTDDGQTWEDVQGFGDKGTFGYAQSPLAANAGSLVQRGGSLTVSLLSGFVDSVTEAQMFGGSNTAAYGAHGRWEIIRFQNATLNPDGSYTLDTFWRGDKGTEWATGLHQSGDLFVLLNDPDNAFVGMSQDSIGQPRTYRAVTFDADIDSASDIAMTYTGVNLECLSPCHPSSSRDGSANLTAKWVRRTRVGGAWRDNVDASLGETSEAYEIDVMSGSTVKRTLTSSTQSVIYSAANQVTDFGSAQASITLRIYQLSSVVGRGYPLEATF